MATEARVELTTSPTMPTVVDPMTRLVPLALLAGCLWAMGVVVWRGIRRERGDYQRYVNGGRR